MKEFMLDHKALTAAIILAGLGALAYGASKFFIIEPTAASGAISE